MNLVCWEGECELRDQVFHVAAWIVPAVKGYSTHIDSRSYLKPGTPAYVKDLIVTDPEDGEELNLGAWSLERLRADVLEQYLLKQSGNGSREWHYGVCLGAGADILIKIDGKKTVDLINYPAFAFQLADAMLTEGEKE